MLGKKIEKPLTKLELEKLEILTFSNCIYGSMYSDGVTWNKIKRLKGKEKSRCLEILKS